MSPVYPAPPAQVVRVASFPGSVARHFRVQRQDAQTEAWHMVATCSSRDEALARIGELTGMGQTARMVAQPFCAVAM